jgi:hypothetical protein
VNSLFGASEYCFLYELDTNRTEVQVRRRGESSWDD